MLTWKKEDDRWIGICKFRGIEWTFEYEEPPPPLDPSNDLRVFIDYPVAIAASLRLSPNDDRAVGFHSGMTVHVPTAPAMIIVDYDMMVQDECEKFVRKRWLIADASKFVALDKSDLYQLRQTFVQEGRPDLVAAVNSILTEIS